VNRLKTRIERKGELDPVLVLRLGTFFEETQHYIIEHHDSAEWLVVDGHHRIAAYLKAKYTAPIKCEWFAGSVSEAVDEGLRRNEITHLEIDQGDKAEAAWWRTLRAWDGDDWDAKKLSKLDVVRLTGCGEGTVAQMRRCVKSHAHFNRREQEIGNRLLGERLRAKLGDDLSEHTWSTVNGVRLDLTPEQEDKDKDAARLSYNLTTRMSDTLSRDPEVTAQALWLYDRDLCPKLVDELQKHMESEAKRKRTEEEQAAHEKPEAAE
jgi:hypothetical protein